MAKAKELRSGFPKTMSLTSRCSHGSCIHPLYTVCCLMDFILITVSRRKFLSNCVEMAEITENVSFLSVKATQISFHYVKQKVCAYYVFSL